MTLIIKTGILTASDRAAAGKRPDESGLLLKKFLEALSIEVVAYHVSSDDSQDLKKALLHMADLLNCDFILTTGGTGLSPRDNTPEATREVIEKEIPGIPEAIRREGLKKTPAAILSRAVAGIRGKTLIINLPGSPEAVQEAFEILRPILRHASEIIKGEVTDCHPSRFSHFSYSHSS